MLRPGISRAGPFADELRIALDVQASPRGDGFVEMDLDPAPSVLPVDGEVAAFLGRGAGDVGHHVAADAALRLEALKEDVVLDAAVDVAFVPATPAEQVERVVRALQADAQHLPGRVGV